MESKFSLAFIIQIGTNMVEFIGFIRLNQSIRMFFYFFTNINFKCLETNTFFSSSDFKDRLFAIKSLRPIKKVKSFTTQESHNLHVVKWLCVVSFIIKHH